jgi:hypothetical protein
MRRACEHGVVRVRLRHRLARLCCWADETGLLSATMVAAGVYQRNVIKGGMPATRDFILFYRRDDPHIKSVFKNKSPARAGGGWRDRYGSVPISARSMRRCVRELPDGIGDPAPGHRVVVIAFRGELVGTRGAPGRGPAAFWTSSSLLHRLPMLERRASFGRDCTYLMDIIPSS